MKLVVLILCSAMVANAYQPGNINPFMVKRERPRLRHTAGSREGATLKMERMTFKDAPNGFMFRWDYYGPGSQFDIFRIYSSRVPSWKTATFYAVTSNTFYWIQFRYETEFFWVTVYDKDRKTESVPAGR